VRHGWKVLLFIMALSWVAVSIAVFSICGCIRDDARTTPAAISITNAMTNIKTDTQNGESMRVHYLEVVTTDVDAACKLYATMHGVTFGDVDQNLGGAPTTRLADGGMIGVRAPMHDGEKPVTRAYVLVEDIEAAVAAAAASGAVIAVPPMEIAGHGTCAIYFQGGIEAGLWQL
jgi:predicted enzyme related to lactoylglutathione lyase